MKKIFISAAIAATLCLTACGAEESTDKDEYERLNEMLAAKYSEITLTVTDTFDENTVLSSEYIFTYAEDGVTVKFAVERFSPIGPGTFSDETKQTLTGQAVIKDGEIVSASGAEFSLPDFSASGFTFKTEYFENINLSEGCLIADVKNANDFLGTELSCSDMKLKAVFAEFFDTIEITYTSAAGSSVKYLYTFAL